MITGFRRHLHVLALAATLALSLLPTLGRLWQAAVPRHAHPAYTVHHGMATGGEDAAARHRHGGCDYCALLAGLALPGPASTAHRVAGAADALRPHLRSGRRAGAPGHGFGARGPPSAA